MAQVSKPAEVTHVEQKSVSDTVVLRTITDWNVAVAAVNRTLRGLLPAYDGYECKEPEPGKFTLTFRRVPGLSRVSSSLRRQLQITILQRVAPTFANPLHTVCTRVELLSSGRLS